MELCFSLGLLVFLITFPSSIDSWSPFEQYDSGFETIPNFNETSLTCQHQLTSLESSTLLTMIDASGKIPTGLQVGNLYSLGEFDECYGIENAQINGVMIYGKYCLGTLPMSAMGPMKKSPNNGRLLRLAGMLREDSYMAGYRHGFCIPDGCTAKDMSILTQDVLTFEDRLCYSKPSKPGLDAGAIVAVCILSFFLLIVILSTVYDIIIFYQQKKPQHDIFIAFSVLTNGQKLLKSTNDQDQLLCLNGIKAITMTWIVFGHEYLLSLWGPVVNFAAASDLMQGTENMFLIGSSVSVDTFFTVGGMVTTYAFLRSMDKGVKFNIILYYVHRYIRLTPALAVVVMFHSTLLKHIGTGPLWGTIDDSLITPCTDYWWSALLYLQNFFHDDDTCVPQTWYLSNDFQIFLLSPLVLIPLQKWPKYGLTLLAWLIAAGIVIPFVISYQYNITQFGSAMGDRMELMWYYYKQTHTRFGPYVIGMLAGYFLYKMKKNKKVVRLNKVTVAGLWIASIAVMVACIYSPHDVLVAMEYNVWDNAFLNGFMRQSWALALCIVVFLCVAGFGGVIDTFLSLPIFQFLTKLSYCMYLVHYGAIGARYATNTIGVQLSHAHMMWSFWSDYVMTVALSLVLCLAFESPMITIERILFRRRPKSTKSGQV